ncbi:MAG: DUF4127 family protein [Candidatus Saganbacteria bacterium]|nr:DUF4127 family protein [Candidatus Saganbacteria bacterium]
MKKIALVPLDDRPCNLKFPAKLASAENIEIICPPKEILGHFLDPGSPDDIASWIESKIDEADAFIISIDMLCYGGLIASRRPKVALEEAVKRLGIISKIKKTRPDVPVYLFNVLMRMSITVENEDSKIIWENIFRFFELSAVAEITKNHGDVKAAEDIKKRIPKNIFDDYFLARKRNHEINKKTIELAGSSFADFIVIAKEDCAVNGPQKEEETDLSKMIDDGGLGQKAVIMNGADEAACVLVSRMILKTTNKTPLIAARYSKNKGKDIALYEDEELCGVVSDHINALGAKETASLKDAEVVLFVHSFDKKQKDLLFEEVMMRGEEERHLLKNFCSEIVLAAEIGKKTAVADCCYANGGDPEFMLYLKNAIDLSSLSSFAGWNTAGNSIGCSLAQAVLPQNKSFLLERFIDDLGYQATVRPKINALIKQKGISPFNLGDNNKEVEQMVISEMDTWTKEFLSSLQLTTYTLQLSLPWPRTFEIDCDIILP